MDGKKARAMLKLKLQITGPSLTRLMRRRGTNKWRVARLADVSYRTLIDWEQGVHVPKDEPALRVGRILGIVE